MQKIKPTTMNRIRGKLLGFIGPPNMVVSNSKLLTLEYMWDTCVLH